MLSLLRSYPYLAWSLAVLAAFAVGLLLCPRRHRGGAVISAALASHCGILAAGLAAMASLAGKANGTEAFYWNPARIGSPTIPLSIEDFVYSFAAGGVGWLLAVWWMRSRLTLDFRWGRALRRLGLAHAVGLATAIAVVLAGAKPMSCLLLPMLAVGVLLLVVRPRFWKLAIVGAAGFTLFQTLLLKGLYAGAPGFAECWNPTYLWGPIVWGIPLDEIAFAATFGAVWPMFAAYAMGARFKEPW